jgi:hypothetical protein
MESGAKYMQLFELVQHGQVDEFTAAWQKSGLGVDFAEVD